MTSLFETRYRERFGAGLKLKASEIDREIRFRPINASLENRDESQGSLNWSIRISDVMGHQSQFAPLADILTDATPRTASGE